MSIIRKKADERTHRQIIGSPSCRTTISAVRNGFDICIKTRRGYEVMPEIDVSSSYDTVKIRLRKSRGPRIGERVMCGRVLVEVKDKRWTENGTLMLNDSITGGWYAWEDKSDE